MANAQLQITTGTGYPANWTVDSLVQNVLVGTGVTVSNARFNGSTSLSCTAIGRFATGNNPTNLGMTEGIIIGTGAVTLAAGANNSGSADASRSGNCSTVTCSMLSSLITQSCNDVAVLEFDFVPKSDSIQFEYVFASEEYPEFVCSVNDVFGFFMSGVNPNGGMYNNMNIALVPGTNLPISINTVNGGGSTGSGCYNQYSAYYVNNAGGTTIQYDGFTTVLTARAKVIPCTPYHLTLAIADAQDAIYDSGVFLKKGSLTSNGVSTSMSNPANPLAPNDLYEGCCAEITLHRPNSISSSERIDILFEGTATNGGDFPAFNSSFYFPADTNEMKFTLCPFQDGMAEGVETAVLILSPEHGCQYQDTITFNIIDTDPIHLDAYRDTLHSGSTQVWLHSTVTGGMPNRTITWTNLSNGNTLTGDSVLVNVMPSAEWQCVVEDGCFNIDIDTVFVGIQRLFAFPCHDTVLCAGEPLTLYMIGADSCVWSFRDRAPFEFGPDTITIHPNESGVYHIKSYKWWRDQWWEDNDSITVFVVPLPEIHVTANHEEICEGNSVTITADGASQYSWDGGVTFSEATSHVYTLDSTRMIHVYGKTNAAECPGNDSVLVVVDTIPSITITGGNGVCNGESVELTLTTTAPDFTWSASPADASLDGQTNRAVISVRPSQTTRYTVNAQNGVCSNADGHTVAVEPMPISMGEVTPQTVKLGNMEATFIDRSQYAVTRDWVLPDGSTRNTQSLSYVVEDDLDSLMLTLIAYNAYSCSDTSTVTVYVDHATLWAPNAFTPDENNNNVFEVKMNDIKDYHIWIFNRQGLLVFESRDPEAFWDGHAPSGAKCPQGVYVYKVMAHKGAYPHEQINMAGTVTLIR